MAEIEIPVIGLMANQLVLTPEILVPRLGDYLLEKGVISKEVLANALEKQSEIKKKGGTPLLGKILVDQGAVSQADLDAAVTDQIMQLHSALEGANHTLEQRVIQRTVELQEALDKLSEFDRMKSNFISNISHELRTPLTHIKGYEELLLAGVMGSLSDQQTSALKVIQQSTERLERLIEDLISFSLVSKGEIRLKLVPINLNALILNVVRHSNMKAQEKLVSISSNLPDSEVTCIGDEEKISWVLLQLIDNAIKFTPEKGKVSVEMTTDEQISTLSVTDTGIGIPEDRMEEIFEPFHQLDGSATRRYGGTGLGLTLVRQIVEAHQSKVVVRSRIGVGSTFEFSLRRITAQSDKEI